MQPLFVGSSRSLPLGFCLCLLGLAAAPLIGCRNNSAGARSDTESVFSLVAPPTPAEAAAMAADPFSADKRQTGILLLANAPFGGESVYLRLYEIGLEDEDSGVRTAAVKALGLHGGSQHAGPIARLLAESDDQILRWEAARTLQRLHDPAAVDALLARLAGEEPSQDVRSAVATALGQYAETRVFDALVAALDDISLQVNRSALNSLKTLTGERLGAQRSRWFEWAEGRNDLFANREPYEFPVFQRDRRFSEWFIPWIEPPNEQAAAPAGMPAVARRGNPNDEPAPE